MSSLRLGLLIKLSFEDFQLQENLPRPKQHFRGHAHVTLRNTVISSSVVMIRDNGAAL